MPITEFLERNARQYPNDVCLVEINPEIKEDRRVTWKEFELIEPNPKTSYSSCFFNLRVNFHKTNVIWKFPGIFL